MFLILPICRRQKMDFCTYLRVCSQGRLRYTVYRMGAEEIILISGPYITTCIKTTSPARKVFLKLSSFAPCPFEVSVCVRARATGQCVSVH